MIDFEQEMLNRDVNWRNVLEVYRDQHAQAVERSQIDGREHDGWVPRIREMDGIEPAALSAIHGRLIALGYLNFDLAGRTDGLRYQLSRDGRHAIRSVSLTADELSEDLEDTEENDETLDDQRRVEESSLMED